MDPKKQAETIYKSLAKADATASTLLARNARMQRGRVVALDRRIDALEDQNAPEAEIERLVAEVKRRTGIAESCDAIEVAIGEAIAKRADSDKNKFG